MARRRMFTVELMDSDRFSDLPANVQMLYIYMSVHADDEGFVSGGRRMAKLYNCPEGLELLEQAGFIIRFPSGVLVITDWYINNTIRKDRSMATIYQAERNLLHLENDRYVLTETNCQPSDNQMTTTCQPNANQVATQNRIEENREEENREEKNRKENNRIDHNSTDQSTGGQSSQPAEDEKTYDENTYPKLWDIFNYCTDNNLKNVDSVYFWSHYNARNWLDEQGNPIRDWRALIRKWNTSPLPHT